MEPLHRKMYPGGSSAVGVEDGLYTGGRHIISFQVPAKNQQFHLQNIESLGQNRHGWRF